LAFSGLVFSGLAFSGQGWPDLVWYDMISGQWSGNSSKWQLIEAAAHRSGNSSKRQVN
jgi:hypothetical protein